MVNAGCSSGITLPDEWIEQCDVMERITEAGPWSEDMVQLYADRTSYIEYSVGFLLPLGPRQAASALGDSNWGGDFGRARFKLARESRGHFLSGSLRITLGIERRGNQYVDSNGETAAYCRTGGAIGGSHIKERVIVMRRALLVEFLREKNQRLLYCFRSHRFSERAPSELGLATGCETVRSEKWHYIREYRDISDGQGFGVFGRDRMRTFSFLFGKSACPSEALH